MRATLFARKPVAGLNMAPLSSMYFTGANDHRVIDDFRPEVHDSDGLLIHTGAGEWIWRPLSNPAQPAVSTFVDNNPRGFGLLQRDRTFEHYQDLDLAYELRPAYWVEPAEGWGEGGVQLAELPTGNETNDNIVASWAPKEGLDVGRSVAFGYRITALTNDFRLTPGARAVNTFRATPHALGSTETTPPGAARFLIDFSGGDLGYYFSDPTMVEIVAPRRLGPRAAHLSEPQHACARLPRRRRRRGRSGPEQRRARVPARRQKGAHRNLDLPLAGLTNEPVEGGWFRS